MAPIATNSVLGDKGANGAQTQPQSVQGVALFTSKLSAIGNAATTAVQGMGSVTESLVKQPTLSSSDVMTKESQYGAHK